MKCYTTQKEAYNTICEWLVKIDAPVHQPDANIEYIGSGLTYDVYHAHCAIPQNGDYIRGEIVVRLPNDEAEENQIERAQVEMQLLERIHQQSHFPCRIPRPLGYIQKDEGTATILEFIPGESVDMRWTDSHIEAPWELFAKLAAGIHRLDFHIFSDILEGFETSREHALNELKIFVEFDQPYIKEGYEWCLNHLPKERPSRLLHGDLLGQNILVEGDGTVGVIDWNESFYGDPAFDLAIVTRGEKHPFRKGRGLHLLLETYNAAAIDPVTPNEIHFYELCLAANWYREEFEIAPDSPYTEKQLKFYRHLLRRICKK